jgi:hypothetical protein
MYPDGSLAAAQADLDNATAHGATGLNTTGFTVVVDWSAGDSAGHYAATLLKQAFAALNPNYVVVDSVGPIWGPYLTGSIAHQLPAFFFGWLADFPDANDFVFQFYDSAGVPATWQLYNDPNMDGNITLGALSSDPLVRQTAYNNVQQLAVSDCPSFCIYQPVGRHFEQDWVTGWYFNPMYPDIYFYNLWKWYYSPYANLGTTASGYNLPADVNYDGKIDVKDVAAVARAYGTSYGPPTAANWVFRADVNNDRRVDIKDVHYVASYYDMKDPLGKWVPGS